MPRPRNRRVVFALEFDLPFNISLSAMKDFLHRETFAIADCYHPDDPFFNMGGTRPTVRRLERKPDGIYNIARKGRPS